MGYDAAYRHFYGQFFDHRDSTVQSMGKLCVGGWPREGGLGGTDPLLDSEEKAEASLNDLFKWLEPLHDLTVTNLDMLRFMLKLEWKRQLPRGHELYVWSNEAGYERL